MNQAGNTVSGRLFILSGPSGVGKDTILARAERLVPDLRRIVTVVTRPRRDSERPDVDYHFWSRDEFERGCQRGAFLESAEYVGNLYGTPRDGVVEAFRAKCDALLKIDVRGFRQVTREHAGAVSVFLLPPSIDVLERHLRTARPGDGREDIERRLAAARTELSAASEYTYRIVNEEGNPDFAAFRLARIISDERARSAPRLVTLRT